MSEYARVPHTNNTHFILPTESRLNWGSYNFKQENRCHGYDQPGLNLFKRNKCRRRFPWGNNQIGTTIEASQRKEISGVELWRRRATIALKKTSWILPLSFAQRRFLMTKLIMTKKYLQPWKSSSKKSYNSTCTQ